MEMGPATPSDWGGLDDGGSEGTEIYLSDCFTHMRTPCEVEPKGGRVERRGTDKIQLLCLQQVKQQQVLQVVVWCGKYERMKNHSVWHKR